MPLVLFQYYPENPEKWIKIPMNRSVVIIFDTFLCVLFHGRVNFKNVSHHGGQFKCTFSHLRAVISKFSPTMVDNLSAFLAI